MDIYFDNAATTKTSNEAIEKIIFMSRENFANPSSVHKLGLFAEREINNAREEVAKIINSKSEEIFFTSGATEANNLAILGGVFANKRNGNHIITQRSEHASVIESVKELEEEGYKISYLQNDENGQIDIEELRSLINDETILVTLMHINNETGSILDIEKVGKLIKSVNKNTLFHTDCVQSFCKIEIDVIKNMADMISFSGHKLHAPKGVGGIFIKKGTKVYPRIFGGSQQKKVRPGTENIIGITALCESIKILNRDRVRNYEYVKSLKDRLVSIEKDIDDVHINVPMGSPYVLNISFIGVKGEVLVHALEERNIYCSTGSACHKGAGSTILQSYGLSKEITESGLRISFCSENTIEEIDILKEALIEIVPMLRRFKKR